MAIPLRDDAPTKRTPWITAALILANVVVFLFLQPPGFQSPPRQTQSPGSAVTSHADFVVTANDKQVAVDRYSFRWGAVPCEILSGHALASRPGQCHGQPPGALLSTSKAVWVTLLTSMFLHGGVLHLVGNMLFLWVFGNNVEDRLGPLPFLAFYVIGGVVATLGYVLANRHGVDPSIGASGAIAAVMGAYLVFRPRGRILVGVLTAAFQVVYVPAFVVLGLFFVTQFFTPAASHVAWQAHAAGMAFGVLAALVLARRFHDPDRPAELGAAAAFPSTF
ncbi:MAG: putative rane protein [Acidimicrobiales bacterium]|nr:putative rane protein [Acidimicrobiales bacterium]